MATKNTKKTEVAKIKIADLEKVIASVKHTSTDIEWNGLNLHINNTIGLEDMMRLVNYIAMSCFDSNTHEYLPEVKDFAIRSGFVKLYTNITLPTDATKQYRLLYGTDIVDTVIRNIDSTQYESIVIAAEDKVRYIMNANVKYVNKKLEDVISSFEDIGNTMTQMISEVDVENVVKIADIISNNGIDEGKVVDAIASREIVAE